MRTRIYGYGELETLKPHFHVLVKATRLSFELQIPQLRVNDSECSYESYIWWSSLFHAQATIGCLAPPPIRLDFDAIWDLEAQCFMDNAYIIATTLSNNWPDLV